MASDSKRALACVTMLLLLAIAGVIILVVLYAERNKDNEELNVLYAERNKDNEELKEKLSKYEAGKAGAGGEAVTSEVHVDWNNCDDVSIIGAGIGGAYAAYRLKDIGKKITIFEYSDRIGGRCYTGHLTDVPDVNVEYGAMRFRPEAHKLLNKSIHDLGLKVVDFGPPAMPFPDSNAYFRGQHMKYRDIPNMDMPYFLPGKFKGKTLGEINWELFRDNTNVDPSIPGYLNDKFNLMSADQVELWKQRHRFMRNQQLLSIKKNGTNGKYILTFQPTETTEGVTKPFSEGHYLPLKPRHTCSSKVILAVGRLALERIDWEGLREPVIQDYLTNSLTDIQATKLYLAFDNAWWRNFSQQDQKEPHYSVSDTPLRQTFEFKESGSSKIAVLNAAYTDWNQNTYFWHKINNIGTRYAGTTDANVATTSEVIRRVMKFLSEIYNVNVKDMDYPVYAAMQLWDNYPYGAGWYRWRPGYNWTKVARRMLRPSTSDDIFVACSAFSSTNRSSWTEGALEIVEHVLKYLIL